MFSELILQETTTVNSFKEENKQTMNESSRLSSSGIPKPTAAVKGTAKPTNSVAPMIVKQENEERPINDIREGKVKEEKTQIKNVSLIFSCLRRGRGGSLCLEAHFRLLYKECRIFHLRGD